MSKDENNTEGGDVSSPPKDLESNVVYLELRKSKTAKDPIGPYYEEDVIRAIREFRGNLTRAAKALNRRRNRLRDYVYANLRVKEVLDEVREEILDEVQSELVYSAIYEGDGASQRFLMQTLGKDRGFTTRVENTGKDGGAMEHNLTLDPAKLTTEQLRAIRGAVVSSD